MDSHTETDRESRLLLSEDDDELFCIDCGALCQYFPMVVCGFDRCPECHLKRERQKVRNAFGTTNTQEALLTFEADAYDGVEVPVR